MGWEVQAHINIEINAGAIPDKTLERIKKMIINQGSFNHSFSNTGIWFTISGNKGVDYDFLEDIKDLLKVNKLVKGFEISACEYVESGDGGYYYSSKDDEEDNLEKREVENHSGR